MTKQTLMEADTPEELEQRQVAGAIRTDFILSAEIMIIALAQLTDFSLWMRAVALAAVGIIITVVVYGAVGLIVKLDDIGLHMAERRGAATRAIGRGLVHVVPKLLEALSGIGTLAMLWVGGGIILHGLEELHILTFIPHSVYGFAASVAETIGLLPGVIEWFTGALGASIIGLIIGGVIVMIVRRFTKHPEQFVVE